MDFEPAGVRVRLHINGNFGDGVEFQVQPFSTNEAFLSSASYKMNLSSVASLAYDQNGVEVDVMGLENNTDVFLSGGEPFIVPAVEQKEGEHSLVISNYVTSKFLGKGGFGKVYLGAHNISGKKVALKLMPMENLDDVSSVERVATEVQALTALRHPHIIELIEVSVDPQNIVLVFEFASEGDMLNYLSTFENHKCPADEADELFDQLIDGVAFAHRHRVVHRDLKLENLLMCTAPNKFTIGERSARKSKVVVKIADFGLSEFFRPGKDFVTNCGSLSYIAPEVLIGDSHAGPPLDVWSLGVILFAMLCGRLPFTNERLGEEERTDTRQIRKRVVNVAYTMDKDVRPAHAELITRMLQLDPEKRATVSQIVHATNVAKHNSFAHNAAMFKDLSSSEGGSETDGTSSNSGADGAHQASSEANPLTPERSSAARHTEQSRHARNQRTGALVISTGRDHLASVDNGGNGDAVSQSMPRTGRTRSPGPSSPQKTQGGFDGVSAQARIRSRGSSRGVSMSPTLGRSKMPWSAAHEVVSPNSVGNGGGSIAGSGLDAVRAARAGSLSPDRRLRHQHQHQHKTQRQTQAAREPEKEVRGWTRDNGTLEKNGSLNRRSSGISSSPDRHSQHRAGTDARGTPTRYRTGSRGGDGKHNHSPTVGRSSSGGSHGSNKTSLLPKVE